MSLIIILFAVGIVLLALEVIVPGAVLGIVGGIAMAIGCVAAFLTYGTTGGAMATISAIILVVLTICIELLWLPRSRLAKRVTMDTTVDGVSQPPLAETSDVMGREAIAETTLAPSGYVRVGSQRLEAFSESGFVRPGEKLLVVGLDNFRVIVTKPTNT
jgi:membrane-bound ClpP family serine protease